MQQPAGQNPGTPRSFEVAPLPEQEVDKLRRLEQELSNDTGDEVVLVAYRRQRAQPS